VDWGSGGPVRGVARGTLQETATAVAPPPCAALRSSAAQLAGELGQRCADPWLSGRGSDHGSALCPRDEPVGAGLAFEVVAEVGVGEAEHPRGALGDGLPFEVDQPELGDDNITSFRGAATTLPGVSFSTRRLRRVSERS
jgi:hypothetical protein